MREEVSVCLLARDEEDLLPRCLASVGWADEIVVVLDDRSADGCAKIAEEAGARVIRHRYEGDVPQRNFALDQATRPWVFSIDPDEVLTEALQQEILRTLESPPSEVGGFEVNRLTWHLGRWIRHGDFYPDWKLRLFRREGTRWAGVSPHGYVDHPGAVRRLEGEMEHYSYRDLTDQVARIQHFSSMQARDLHARGSRFRATQMVLRPPARFLRAYLLKQGWRDGFPGFVIAAATAFNVFLKYAKLWELEQRALGSGSTPPDGKGPP